jgi:hypothetical protein
MRCKTDAELTIGYWSTKVGVGNRVFRPRDNRSFDTSRKAKQKEQERDDAQQTSNGVQTVPTGQETPRAV